MKNPLKYLKHLVKDPVNTIAEADARKKEIMPLLYGSSGLLAVGVILQLITKLEFMTVFSFIGLVGVGFCVFLLAMLKDINKRFEGLTCDRCHKLAEIKTPEDFAKYVSYTVEKDEAVFDGYSGNHKATDGVFSLVKFSASSKAAVTVDLTCPHCGQVKHLRYSAVPFKCHAEERKVGALQYAAVRTSLETAVRTAINDYNTPERRDLIPYSIHSSKNPHFKERTTFKGANSSGAHPNYMGVRIDHRKDIEEMLEHYFVLNELNGSLYDPNKPKKTK